jgi:small subunit ribosomal protein S15
MARMHSRRKGKAGSKRPFKRESKSWVRLSAKEVELLVVKLAKFGSSHIGLQLRDTYGIPDAKVVLGKSISTLLEEKKLAPDMPDDLKSLVKKTILIRKHLETNKQDQTAKRGLKLTESKMNRLVKYYKKKSKLSLDWKYEPDKARLLIE